MRKIQVRALVMLTFLSIALATGCSKDSSTDSGAATVSTKDCGKGQSCEGTYSTSSSDSKEWTGVCEVKQVDSGDWITIWFSDTLNNCGFKWIRAQGSVGSDWASLASGADREFMVEYTGEDVFTLRLCENGGNEDNTGCQ